MLSIQMIDNSDKFISAIDKQLKNALWAIGATAEGYAKDNCPVDTGRLRNSITHIQDDKSVYIGTDVEYAPYVEEGSGKRIAHHFLRDACVDHTDEYRDLMEQALKA